MAREVALVVAAAENDVIGRDGAMPWHVPSDLKTFRRLTMGCAIIMGRKTFEAIGKALDGRLNIVVTRDRSFAATDVTVTHSVEEAMTVAREQSEPDRAIMVIGGGQIYAEALRFADTVYLTRIHGNPQGDTWFPPLDPAEWQEVARSEVPPDPRDDHAATLITLKRAASPV